MSRPGIISQIEPQAENDALKFDTTYSDLGILPVGLATGVRTISMWVKPNVTTFNGQSRQFFANQYSGNTGKRTFSLEFFTDGRIRAVKKTSGYFEFCYSNSGFYFQANTKYYITFSAGILGTRLYVNGNLHSSTGNSASFIGSERFTIGGASDQTSNPASWFPGEISGLSIWNTERTPSEIVSDMARSFDGTETGLKAHYKFNGSGSVITEINNNYNGTISTTNTNPNYIDDVMRTKF